MSAADAAPVSSASLDPAGSAPPRRLGIVYEPGSIPILTLVAALAGRWEIVWILAAGTDAATLRRLGRFGVCLHTAGRPAAAVADDLREHSVGGITTFADAGLRSAAALADAIGVPGHRAEVAIALTDKVAQRTALAAAGLPTPGFCQVDPDMPARAIEAAAAGLRYPAVVKPAVGTGGRDTLAVSGIAALVAELNRRRAGGDRRPVIVEECFGRYPPEAIDGFGDYVSVELLAGAGRVDVLAVSGRMPLTPPFRETGSFLPSQPAGRELAEVEAVAVAAVAALGVRVGCLHVEIKRTPDGPRVIEVNGRVAGGGIPELVRAAGGVDLYGAAAAVAMGEAVDPVPVGHTGVQYALVLQPPVGVPSRLRSDWRQCLAALPGLRRTEVRAKAVTVTPADGSYGYLLMVVGEAPDHRALHAIQALLAGLAVPAGSGDGVTPGDAGA
jgi:predicted ATP-grasp superfamily ATP-dependent carboligase